MRTGVPCNENRFYPVGIGSQGVPCELYRVWVYSVGMIFKANQKSSCANWKEMTGRGAKSDIFGDPSCIRTKNRLKNLSLTRFINNETNCQIIMAVQTGTMTIDFESLHILSSHLLSFSG